MGIVGAASVEGPVEGSRDDGLFRQAPIHHGQEARVGLPEWLEFVPNERAYYREDARLEGQQKQVCAHFPPHNWFLVIHL